MRQWIFTLIAAVMTAQVSAQGLQFGPQNAPQNQVLDEIALIVNNEAVTRRQLSAEMNNWSRQLGAVGGMPAEVVQQQALEQIIMDRLLKQLINRTGVEPSAQDIDQAVAQVAAQNNVPVARLLAQVKRDTGLNEAGFRQQLGQDIVLQQIRQAMVGGEIQISEAQINDQIAQIARTQGSRLHLQDLLVAVPKGDTDTRGEAVKAIVAQVSQALASNANDLAQAAGSVAGARFTDLGEVNIGQIPPSFAAAIADLNSGEIVGTPVVDEDGMHFLKVVSKAAGAGGYNVPEADVMHILLRVSGAADAVTQKERIDNIYHQLQQGVPFAELAQRYSQDTVSATRGGALGWMSADQVVPEFAEVMVNAPLNTVTPPFRSPYGWHVLLVKDKRMVDRQEDILRQQIREGLYNKYMEDAWQQRLLELREEAYVEIR